MQNFDRSAVGMKCLKHASLWLFGFDHICIHQSLRLTCMFGDANRAFVKFGTNKNTSSTQICGI
jgi:hypothetical protein